MAVSGPETTAEERFGHLFDLIDDPVVEVEFVDHTPVVRAVNPAFEAVFGYDREAVVGAQLNDLIVPEGAVDESERFDHRTAQGKPTTGLVTRQTATGPREFLYRGVPYERDGGRYSFAIYTDITEQRRYEQHMQVIHRLLRHDLRNDLQVVLTAAEQVTERAEAPGVADLGETVVSHARQLLTSAEETRTVERVLTADHEPEPTDVAAVAQSVTTTEAAVHGVPVTTTLPDHLFVEGVPWLRAAIAALVENAVVHGSDSPDVEVSASRRQDCVAVEVANDGPGIPQSVRGPVFEDSDITQLQHNTGIGLWLARWVAEACGGHLGYQRCDGWTRVRLWLRPAEPDEESLDAG
ncbi:MAG: PAS domain S-box-containing protein [Salinirussus sp.]